MAKRYCGEAVIDIRWDASAACYKAVVSPGLKVELTRVVHPPIKMDAPEAYDAAARAALAKALDMSDHAHDLVRSHARTAADLAASGIDRGAYVIVRKKPDPCPECGKDRNTLRPEVRSFHPGAC